MEGETQLLLVEDDAIIALAQSLILRRAGFAVETAHSGEEAVERVSRGDPVNLILMDIDLGPGIDGTAAAARILETRAVPIVFLTGHSEQEMVSRVKGLTRYGYVLKNSGEFVLIEAITMALELFRAHQEAAERERRISNLNRTYNVIAAVSQEILRSADPETIFEAACRIVVERGAFLFAWVGVVDAAGEHIVPLLSHGDHRPYLDSLYIDLNVPSVSRGPTARCYTSGRHVIVNDIVNTDEMGPWKELAAEHGFRSSAAFPIIVNQVVQGVFGIYAGSTGYFNEDEVAVLDELVADIGYALEVAQTKEAAAAAEQARQDWEHLMGFVIRHDPSAIAVYDTQMRYLYVSDKYLHDHDLQEEDVIGRLHYDVVPDVPQRWRDAHRRAMHGEELDAEDDFFVRSDGSVEYNRWSCRPWRRRNREIGGIILYTEVITRRKLAESEHRRVLSALRSLLQHSPDLISVVDTHGKWIMVSDSVAGVTGVAPEKMEGRRFEELIDPEIARRFNDRIQRVVETRTAVSEPEEIRTPTGTRLFRTTLFPAQETGDRVELVGIVSADITAEQEAMKAAEQATAEMISRQELMLRESHHRIKNDMQIVNSMLSLQAGRAADEAAAGVLSEASARVEIMMRLYDTIYLRQSSTANVDLADLVHRLVEGIVQRYGDSAPRIVVDARRVIVSPRSAAPVAVIVNELVTNSAKYACACRAPDRNPGHVPDTGLSIAIRLHREDEHVVLSVADNGDGFPAHVLSGQSDGFGLTLIRTFAAQLGGEVTMTNEPDGGAITQIRFPVGDKGANP